jgi:hypothetical protein
MANREGGTKSVPHKLSHEPSRLNACLPLTFNVSLHRNGTTTIQCRPNLQHKVSTSTEDNYTNRTEEASIERYDFMRNSHSTLIVTRPRSVSISNLAPMGKSGKCWHIADGPSVLAIVMKRYDEECHGAGSVSQDLLMQSMGQQWSGLEEDLPCNDYRDASSLCLSDSDGPVL